MPKPQYASKKILQPIKKAIEYGNIIAIKVPIPVPLTYFWQYTTTSGKYGISGVMIFELESPTRYAACVKSGEIPSCISIGTKIGPNSAHFAELDPTNRFTNAVKKIIPTTVTELGRAIAFNSCAPSIASNAPRFDLLNAAINNAQKNAITI